MKRGLGPDFQGDSGDWKSQCTQLWGVHMVVQFALKERWLNMRSYANLQSVAKGSLDR